MTDDPAAKYLSSRGLLKDFSSRNTLRLLKECIEYCCSDRSKHEQCSKTSGNQSMPTRVVDCTTPSRPRLLGTKGARGCYAALSYVWGEDQPHKTTTRNIDQYMLTIDNDLLPQTIRDAIWTTHELGIEYLWVDTLCIIQDSDDDRNRELARMGNIYSEAHITIIAACARRASEGFLHKREDLYSFKDVALPFISPEPEGEDGTIWASRVTWEPSYVGSDPISARGWCFQENVLSPRCVIFASHTVQYQCASTFECVGHACNPCWTDNGRVESRRQHKLPAMDVLVSRKCEGRLPNMWKSMLEDYSQTSVTVSGDRLVALSGVAERLHAAFQTDYLAGLWRNRLLEDLQWYTESTHPPQLPAPSPRPNPDRAPTWSWASIDSAIAFQEEWQPSTPLAEVVLCKTAPKLQELPFGEVKPGGILVLRAPTLKCILRWDSQKACAHIYILTKERNDDTMDAVVDAATSVDEIKVGTFKPDSADDVEQRMREAHIILLAQTVEAYPRNTFVGFVIEFQGTQWRRIGWFADNTDSQWWNDQDIFERGQDILARAPVVETAIS